MQVKTSARLQHRARVIWGTLDVDATRAFFDTLNIPQLIKNNGCKTGAELGCTVKINIPIATPVTDDNVDQGPLRIVARRQRSSPKGMMRRAIRRR